MSSHEIAVRSSNALVPQNLDQAMRMADMMARNSLVPDHFQSKPGNCLLVIEVATRWNMSPYAVAQCTFVHQGKLGYEGKLVAAAIESCGAITSEGFDDVYEGEGNDRKITLSATIVGQTKPRSITVTWKDAHSTDKNGNPTKQWVKNRDQMLYYYASRAWCRRYRPGVLLGVYTYQELTEPKDDLIADDAPNIINGTAEELADEAVRQAAEATGTAVPQSSESFVSQLKPEKKAPPKPTGEAARVYTITTPKFSRSHGNADDWLADWDKVLEGYVSIGTADPSRIPDAWERIQTLANMNTGSLETVASFDFKARQVALERIQNALNALRDADQAARPRTSERKAPDETPPDDGAPPADNEAPDPVDQPHDGPTSQSEEQESLPPEDEEFKAAQAKAERDVKLRQKDQSAGEWVNKFLSDLDSKLDEADHIGRIEPVTQFLRNADIQGKLAGLKKHFEHHYNKVLEGCLEDRRHNMLREAQENQGSHQQLLDDILTHSLENAA